MYTFLLPVENHRSKISVRKPSIVVNILPTMMKTSDSITAEDNQTATIRDVGWSCSVPMEVCCWVMLLVIKPTSHVVCSFLLPNPVSYRPYVPSCLVWSQMERTSRTICTTYETLDALRTEGEGRWVWDGRTRMSL